MPAIDNDGQGSGVFFYKGGELLGSITTSGGLDMVEGKKKPKIKSKNSWEVQDELYDLGYTIKIVRITVRKPKDSDPKSMMDDLGV